MNQYHDLVQRTLLEGIDKGDRTGTGTRSIFGHQMRFDLSEGFPLLTTKKLHWKSIVHELLWFLKGDTNIRYLQENGVRIWDEWADENGDLGPVYGSQWRSWPAPKRHERRFGEDGEFSEMVLEMTTIDQISNVVDQIRKSPDSRRLIVSAWNPAEVDEMALPPCHCLFQFYTRPMTLTERINILAERQGGLDFPVKGNEKYYENILAEEYIPTRWLDCQLYQRSADIFLGVPFNIASYALLTQMIAHVTGMQAGHFVHSFGDAHIYSNHTDQVAELLQREVRLPPSVILNPEVTSLFDFRFEDIELLGYDPHPAIKAPVAV